MDFPFPSSHIESQNIYLKKKRTYSFQAQTIETKKHFFYIVEQMRSLRPDIMFHAVGQCSDWKKRMSSMENITVYPFLSDDYYSLLSKCDYNFLPLTFATANNALLEAQALGITSILPKISGNEK